MNSKLIIVVVFLILTVLGGGYFLMKGNNQIPASQPTQVPTQTVTTTAPTSSSEKVVEVTLTSQGYNPAALTIDKGTKVVWTNKSGSEATVNSDPHPFHTDYAPLNLGNFKDGEKLELVFDKAGTFKYHNHFNSSEKGTIIVK